MSVENLDAGKRLLDAGKFRSSTSRAYYAVYAGLTSELSKIKRINFVHGGNNPSHEQLKKLTKDNLPRKRFNTATRTELGKIVNRLRMARVEADYSPQAGIGRQVALDAVREAAKAIDLLGIKL
jgi:uncharacterized protein (UPF0332 family)